VTAVLSSPTAPGPALARLARVYLKVDAFVEKVVLNKALPDAAMLHVASHGKGRVLEIIGLNQARIAACPALVKALYFNPNTRMATSNRVLEFAVRENLPIQDMPGYREIVASILGEMRAKEVLDAQAKSQAASPQPAGQPPAGQPPAAPSASAAGPAPEGAPKPAGATPPVAPAPMAPPAPPPPAGETPDFGADLLSSMDMEVLEDDVDAFGDTGTRGAEFKEEVEDEDFDALLLAMMESAGGEGEDEDEVKALGAKIRKMRVPERIRLALMGNASAREILIRDSNKLVSAAVLRNPGLNDKDIAKIAANKMIQEDVIRIIAMNKDWVKNYAVKMGLVQNPKTPPNMALAFLKFLNSKDLKNLSQSKDVPPLIARTAKRSLQAKEQGGGGGGG
jgi:hypothetical protein